MTIQERAWEFVKQYTTKSMEVDKILMLAYTYGATEQRKIDINRACKWFDDLLDGRPFLDKSWKDELKKALEE